MVPVADLNPHFAKHQLTLLLREWYMHPNRQEISASGSLALRRSLGREDVGAGSASSSRTRKTLLHGRCCDDGVEQGEQGSALDEVGAPTIWIDQCLS